MTALLAVVAIAVVVCVAALVAVLIEVHELRVIAQARRGNRLTPRREEPETTRRVPRGRR